MKDSYIENLESVIKQMLRPLKNIPFKLVVESLSGHKIEFFNPKEAKDKALLEKLIKATKLAGERVNKVGILRPRPNEVGNDIEPFVKEALRSCGYKDADTPLTNEGSKKTTGYPDLGFTDEFGRNNYIECKTFNIESLDTTFRSFYLSPSDNFKVTKDARHFVISFEIFVDGRTGKNNIYKCKSWKILSLENLSVNVKYEFNADNRQLYAKALILAEGKL